MPCGTEKEMGETLFVTAENQFIKRQASCAERNVGRSAVEVEVIDITFSSEENEKKVA